MKRYLSLILMVTVLLQSVGGHSTLGDEIISEEEMIVSGSVISEELQEAFENGTSTDTYRVMIWIEDIDYEKVEQMAEAATATSWESLEAEEENLYLEALDEMVQMKVADGEMSALSLKSATLSEEERMLQDYASVYSLVSDDMRNIQANVDALVMAEREAASDLYEVNNQALTSNELIAKDIKFVSRYSPMVIAELSQEQIEEMAEDDGVVGIYLCEEEEMTEESIAEEVADQKMLSSQSSTITVSSTDENKDLYLEYLSVNKVHGMTLTGKNAKVGIVDDKQVSISDHRELYNSNIVQVGVTSLYNVHAVNMSRIICGSYGVAPDCILYSAYLDQGDDDLIYFSAIELLLDEGVSVINMSRHHNTTSMGYNAIEMWYDHISVNHSVLVVKSAGNDNNENGTLEISSPGLAYNVLTVGNVDCLTDELADDSCYVNGNYAKKPDVVSAGKNVLGLNNGGTSAATATVTGIIALMLEAKPSLAGKPHIIKAIVVASADHIAGSDSFPSGYDEKQGAGVVNALRAVLIISRGQYYGNSTSSTGTVTLTKSVSYGSTVSSFAFVGTKMNVATGIEHSPTSYSNCGMPEINLVVLTASGGLVGTSAMNNSSVEVVHGSYSSEVEIKLIFSTMYERGIIYGVAWY